MIIRNIFKGKTPFQFWSLTKIISGNFSMVQMQEINDDLIQKRNLNILKIINEQQNKPLKTIVLDNNPSNIANINEFNEGEIYQMAFKKTERAKRKRRRRRYGSKTSARWK